MIGAPSCGGRLCTKSSFDYKSNTFTENVTDFRCDLRVFYFFSKGLCTGVAS